MEITAHDFLERVEPARMLVEAGNLGKRLAAGLEESFAAAHGNFFERFEAIGDKGRTHDEKLFDASLGKAFKFAVGIGRQPRVAAEPGLERNGIFLRGDVGLFHKGADGREALRSIAGVVRDAGCFTAVWRLEAVTTGRIGFSQMPLG